MNEIGSFSSSSPFIFFSPCHPRFPHDLIISHPSIILIAFLDKIYVGFESKEFASNLIHKIKDAGVCMRALQAVCPCAEYAVG